RRTSYGRRRVGSSPHGGERATGERHMIVSSTSPDIAIPEVSITEYVLRHADRLRDKPALIDGPTGRALTYGQLRDGVRRVPAGPARRGIREGGWAAVYSAEHPPYRP